MFRFRGRVEGMQAITRAAVRAAIFPVRPRHVDAVNDGAMAADDADTAHVIALLADALERIAETTTDATTRAIAEDALALFQEC
jgi:hypothetical protein